MIEEGNFKVFFNVQLRRKTLKQKVIAQSGKSSNKIIQSTL